MSADIALRAVGTLACMYTIGLFVTVMSMAALNAASYAAGAPCSGAGCHVAYREMAPAPAEPEFIRTAAILLAENI
jgi:hypothetical protein